MVMMMAKDTVIVLMIVITAMSMMAIDSQTRWSEVTRHMVVPIPSDNTWMTCATWYAHTVDE